MIKISLRIAFLLLILFTSVCNANAQKTKSKSLNNIKNQKSASSISVVDSLYFESIIKMYGDNLPFFIDSLSKTPRFYNVLKRKKLTDSVEFAASKFKAYYPLQYYGYTNDFENIFTEQQEKELDSIISTFKKETANEIAIVTFDSAKTNAKEFDGYVNSLLNYWGVGKQDKKNGILIGISKSLRMIRISNGFGIKKNLSDDETKKIIDTIIIPEFKNKNFYNGTRLGILALMEKIK